jgi:hypothetical protein
MECEEVMPPPPSPTVTDLQPASVGPLCPGEIVEFKASTSPPSETVIWTVAVNAGEPRVVQGDGNTLRISGKGQTKVVTASLTNARSATATWKLAELKIGVPPGPDNGRYVITDEPRMPIIPAAALGIGGPASISGQWEIDVSFTASDCPPFGPPDLRTRLHVSRTGGNQITTDFFGNVVRGGSISFSVNGTVNGCPVSARGGGGLVGTNPQQTDIRAALPHQILQRIACKESGQRQFDAPPNGGTDFCPLFGPGGTVGIMQIANPTDDEVWNWRANVAKGIELFNENVDAAREYPNRVRDSAGFQHLVDLFNQKRGQQELSPLQVTLPDFWTGDFDDDDNLQELELDAIRGYNGWFGSDRFGFELHEFRVAVDRIDGEEVLVVTNVNEETLQGEAVWERVPVADRPAAPGSPNYVEEVLAFLPGCTPAPAATCPQVSVISVDPSDTRTHEIPGTLSSTTHLVTVKGRGDIVLRADIVPDTPRLRSQLTWEADGAVITPGGGGRLAKISRNTPSGARIPVRLKVRSQTCTQVVVWIIWCTLEPNTGPGTSSITGQPLGQHGGRLTAQNGYRPAVGIDWTATIHPAQITDIDRPAIENQVRVSPPIYERGVANHHNHDATGRGFSGWDMSRQVRQRVCKGNPDKVPPEPIAETTNADPEPQDRPIAYPAPADDVQGNDDREVGIDEDSWPYDEGAGTPGRGIRGTLRSTDQPSISFLDAEDYNRIPSGEDGDTFRWVLHFREFVRVQLGRKWYRCSEFGLWRWHMHAKFRTGWGPEPGRPDVFDSTNDDF